jgi:Prokaryotic phospholipase A2
MTMTTRGGVLVLLTLTIAVVTSVVAPRAAAVNPVTLQSGIGYSRGFSWNDSSGRYTLKFQTDGNLVLSEAQHPHALWDTHTWNTDAQWLVMEPNGNLALYNNTGTIRWQTGTGGAANNGSYGSLQTDGNLVLYRPSGPWTWNADTWQRSATSQTNTMYSFSFSPYATWENVASSGAGSITSYAYLGAYPWLNWTNDSCSAPLAGDGPWNFNIPCERHDFQWRNLNRLQLDFPTASFWTGRNQNAADDQFAEDMVDRCNQWTLSLRVACYASADAYFVGVQTVSPYSTSGYDAHYYTW